MMSPPIEPNEEEISDGNSCKRPRPDDDDRPPAFIKLAAWKDKNIKEIAPFLQTFQGPVELLASATVVNLKSANFFIRPEGFVAIRDPNSRVITQLSVNGNTLGGNALKYAQLREHQTRNDSTLYLGCGDGAYLTVPAHSIEDGVLYVGGSYRRLRQPEPGLNDALFKIATLIPKASASTMREIFSAAVPKDTKEGEEVVARKWVTTVRDEGIVTGADLYSACNVTLSDPDNGRIYSLLKAASAKEMTPEETCKLIESVGHPGNLMALVSNLEIPAPVRARPATSLRLFTDAGKSELESIPISTAMEGELVAVTPAVNLSAQSIMEMVKSSNFFYKSSTDVPIWSGTERGKKHLESRGKFQFLPVAIYRKIVQSYIALEAQPSSASVRVRGEPSQALNGVRGGGVLDL